jgi:hypothetical protein
LNFHLLQPAADGMKRMRLATALWKENSFIIKLPQLSKSRKLQERNSNYWKKVTTPLTFMHFEAAKTYSYLRIAYSFSIVSAVNVIGVKYYRKMVSS